MRFYTELELEIPKPFTLLSRAYNIVLYEMFNVGSFGGNPATRNSSDTIGFVACLLSNDRSICPRVRFLTVRDYSTIHVYTDLLSRLC